MLHLGNEGKAYLRVGVAVVAVEEEEVMEVEVAEEGAEAEAVLDHLAGIQLLQGLRQPLTRKYSHDYHRMKQVSLIELTSIFILSSSNSSRGP